MLPQKHVLIGLFFSVAIFFVFPSLSLVEIGVFFLSSFLIDFDHYLYFLYRKQDFGFVSAYKFFRSKGKRLGKKSKKEQGKYYTGVYVLHGIEPVSIVLLFGYFLHSIFYMVALGMVLHLICDIFRKAKTKEYPRKISLIYDIYMSQNKKLI